MLVGLALGDADSHTALRAALAVAGFALGVLIAARALGPVRAADRWPARAPAVLVGIAVVQAGFLAGWIAIDGRPEGIELGLLACASAVAMGGQSAATRAWHTGIVTTYVSGTLTMLLGDLAESSGARPDQLRRLSVIAAVAGGATLGAVMLTHAHGSVPVVPVSLTALVAIAAATLPRTPAGQRPPDRITHQRVSAGYRISAVSRHSRSAWARYSTSALSAYRLSEASWRTPRSQSLTSR